MLIECCVLDTHVNVAHSYVHTCNTSLFQDKIMASESSELDYVSVFASINCVHRFIVFDQVISWSCYSIVGMRHLLRRKEKNICMVQSIEYIRKLEIHLHSEIPFWL